MLSSTPWFVGTFRRATKILLPLRSPNQNLITDCVLYSFLCLHGASASSFFIKDDSSSVSVVLGGTACRGGIGPPVGAVDIGVSKSAYYFRIALPGVKKDPCEFNCEIENDGNVNVRGVTTTGGQNVSRYSRVYEMKFQQQCPTGPFTLSFCLPGPVDPTLFSPTSDLMAYLRLSL